MSERGPSLTALIVGHGPADARVALDLAQAGIGVTLLTAGDWLTPGADGLAGVPSLLEAARHPKISLLTGATIETIHTLTNSCLTERLGSPKSSAGRWLGVEPNGGPGLRVTVRQAPRYVDPNRCTACGACAETCPVLLPGTDGDASHKAIYRGGVPTAYAIDKAGTAPCRHACPINQRAQGYVALIRAGDFQTAYHTIKRDNPFPAVCGRVCNHRCEEACTRHQVDEPVAVMALKRFVADWAWERKQEGALVEVREKVEMAPRSGYRVAIVGAGPAGLAAGRELNRLGHDVTVLEALPVPGGMMRVGIPSFRLDRERLNWDIDEILAEGVELRTNTHVENIESLFSQGYDAVVLAVGLHVSQLLSIPGVEEPAPREEEGWPGVTGAVEFLRRVNLGERPDGRGRRVVVVGGGSTAMDTARFYRRLGAEVTVVYRRSLAEMPAHDFEVDDAQREGVTLRLLSNPVRILRQDGHVTAIECVQTKLGDPDESGRRRPIPIEGSEFTLPADTVVLAIGQRSDLSLLPEDGLAVQHKGIVQHDPATLMTGWPGLFVVGDVAGADGFVVDAIAMGLRGARSVDRYLRGDQGVAEPVNQPAVQLGEAQVAQRMSWAAPQGSARARTRSVLPQVLLGDFKETDVGLREAEAIAEATRCLSCGLCSECLACHQVCSAGAIDHGKQARHLEFYTDAVIRPDDSSASVDLPGVYTVGNGISLTDAVDRAMAQLGVARLAPVVEVAAPSRWQAASGQVGVFLCRCGGEIERTVDLAAVRARVEGLPGVAYVGRIDFACHPEGNEAIRSALADRDLDGAILAACSCCALDQICYSCTTQRTRCKERLGVWDGLKGLPLRFVNVREQCAFVHWDNPDAATLKASDLIATTVGALSLARGERRIPITASIDSVRCRGCDDCVTACGLQAIQIVGSNDARIVPRFAARIAQVDATRCLGCGVCMAVCSSGAILAGDTSDAQAEAMLMAMGDLSDKTVVFSCNWGAYSAVEAAGVAPQGYLERPRYDPSVRLIRLMCAGRAHEGLIMRAFAQGAARVLVLACRHEGDGASDGSLCHYHTGSNQAKRSVEQVQRLLSLLGIDPARLTLVEMHPGDVARFIAAVEEFVTAVTV